MLAKWLEFFRDGALICVSAYAFTLCLLYLPKTYKKRQKFLCFLCIASGLSGIAIYAYIFS